MQLLIDAEMKPFDGLDTPVVFMQNVITDLLLGLRMNDTFRMFHDHVRKRYGAEPGFITMNVPRLLDVLDALGIDNPIVCANINKIGFRMCGGVALYEETLRTRRFRPVAMSVLASGAIAPREAIDYVCAQPTIESIVFGASGHGNIRQTKALIDELSASSGEQTTISSRLPADRINATRVRADRSPKRWGARSQAFPPRYGLAARPSERRHWRRCAHGRRSSRRPGSSLRRLRRRMPRAPARQVPASRPSVTCCMIMQSSPTIASW